MTQAWLAKNPDYVRQNGRDRYMLDPESFKAKSRAYYAANRDRINAAQRAKAMTSGEIASRRNCVPLEKSQSKDSRFSPIR